MMTAVEEYDKVMASLGGCGNGYCLVTGKAKGQHTNGGCRCWRNRDDMWVQRFMAASRRLRDSLEIDHVLLAMVRNPEFNRIAEEVTKIPDLGPPPKSIKDDSETNN